MNKLRMLKDAVFWDMVLCGSSKKDRLFGRTYSLHLQGNNTLSLVSMKMETICSSRMAVLLEPHSVMSQQTTSFIVIAMKNILEESGF
jgi:hypothetical protein